MSKIKKYLPFLLILIYLTLSSLYLGYPGFQYDELLFGSAAFGGFDGSFIYWEYYHFPVMIMPYIGALKSHLYFFIFSIFETSYISIRLPMIILSAFSLWIIYKFVLKASNYPTAILSILFLVADSNFISILRVDIGPVAMGLFFRCLALLYFFKFIEVKKSKYLIIIAISLLLGFYDKFNFVWFIIAFVIAATIFYQSIFTNIFEILKTKQAKISIGILIISFGILGILVLQLGLASELSIIPSSEHLHIVYTGSISLTDGSLFYQYLIGDWKGSQLLGWFIWGIIIITSILMITQPKSDSKTFHYFQLTLLILVIFQIVLTNKANAPWHIFMLQPMLSILLASSLVTLGKIFIKNEQWQSISLVLVSILIFSSQILTYSVYLSSYKKPYRNVMWSKKLDELYDYTQSVPNKIVSIDWGFHNQFLTLYRKSGKFYEYAFPLDASDLPNLLEKPATDYFNPENKYMFLLHGEETTGLKTARKNFFKVVEKLELNAVLVKEIQEDGKVLYEVYQIKSR